MSPEYRVILERMRSSAGVVRRAVEAAPPARFAVPPREGGDGRPPGHDRGRARSARAAAPDAARRRVVAPGSPSLARRHVHRVSRSACRRARRGARGADRGGDASRLSARGSSSPRRRRVSPAPAGRVQTEEAIERRRNDRAALLRLARARKQTEEAVGRHGELAQLDAERL